MSTLMTAIQQEAGKLPEGGVLTPKDFLHLASRAAVDQTFSRLVKAGKLLRVSRGAYVAPVNSKFGERAPAPERVISSLAEKKGESIAPGGAAAANAFGLTTQVPVREVFHTSGRSRLVRLGTREIELRHVPRWHFSLGTSPAGSAVRALAWLGEKHVTLAVPKLRRQLPLEEWEKLLGARAGLPSWMAKALGEAQLNG